MFCACCGRVAGGVAFTPDFDEDHWRGHQGGSRRRRRSTPAAGRISVISKCLVLWSLRLAPSATMGSAFNIAVRVACETVKVLSVHATGSHLSQEFSGRRRLESLSRLPPCPSAHCGGCGGKTFQSLVAATVKALQHNGRHGHDPRAANDRSCRRLGRYRFIAKSSHRGMSNRVAVVAANPPAPVLELRSRETPA